jgi:hypothetical protein
MRIMETMRKTRSCRMTPFLYVKIFQAICRYEIAFVDVKIYACGAVFDGVRRWCSAVRCIRLSALKGARRNGQDDHQARKNEAKGHNRD